MLKTAGVILISASLALYGVFRSHRIMDRSHLLQEICLFIRNVEQGIRFGGKNLQTILASGSFPILNRAGFTKAAENSLYRSEAARLLTELNDEEKDNLSSFLINIGKSHYCEKEINLCRMHLAYFEETAEKAAAECRTKASLYRKLGIISAVCCAVILL